MAFAGHYRHVFETSVPRRKRGLPAVFQDCSHVNMMDLEFSEYGRTPRFMPGWFILPAVVTGMAIIAAVLLLIEM
jgi:hypothetical protein